MGSTVKGAEDQSLIRRFVEKKDNDAFQALVVKHLKSIRRILFSIFNGNIDFNTTGQVVLSPDPAEQVLKKERHSELLNALSELREEERSLLLMKDVEGMTNKEIAKVMGIPGGTIKSRLHRIRDKMVSILTMR